jgi:hypothetical protein
MQPVDAAGRIAREQEKLPMDGNGIESSLRPFSVRRIASLTLIGFVAAGFAGVLLDRANLAADRPAVPVLLGIVFATSVAGAALALLLRLFPLAASLAAVALIGALGTVGAETTDILVPDPLADLASRRSLVDLVWLVGVLALLIVLPALAGGLAWFYLRDGTKLHHRHRRAAHQMFVVTVAIAALLGALLVTKPEARAPDAPPAMSNVAR